jgi:hypothetical protein
MSAPEKEVSKLIMNKCGELPEVIVAISEYSAEEIEDEYTWVSSIEVLEYLNDNFMDMIERNIRFHGLTSLFSWMHSYFDGCSDSVKPCLFYISVFSVDKNIRRRRLVRRWIAEGYSRDTSSGSTAEEKGESLFSELVKLNIIQKQSQDGEFVHQIRSV